MLLPQQRLLITKLMVLSALLTGHQSFAWGQAKQPTQRSTKSSPSDWPRFRGPTGMGIAASTGLPETWGPEENIQWKSKLPGPGDSSPIVWGQRIFLTCYTGYLVPDEEGSLDQLQRHVVCVSRTNGKILWNRAIKAKLPEEASIRDHGYAANSVVVDTDRVYAFLGKSGVYAFNHEGKQLWQADVGSKTHGWGTSASPILYQDLLIVNASVESSSLVALDKQTGAERWRADGIREAWNTPVVTNTADGSHELVIATHGAVLGFNPSSGKRLWFCDTDITWYMVPSVIAAQDVVYVLGGRSGTAALAVRTGGRGDVTASHRLWTSEKGSNVTSPVVHNGHLYWAHEKLGIAYCANAATGELTYEKRLNRSGQVYASSLLVNGKIYHLTRSGKTFVLAADPTFTLLATNDLRDGSRFDASPAVSGNQLLIRSNKYLYCIGK